MKAKFIISILSMLILITCTNQKTKNKSDFEPVKPYPHIINMSEGLKNAAQLKLSDIADSIKYVVLSKQKEVLIGDFRRLQMTDSNIYISSDGLVLRFNLSGKFLNSIGRNGRGPEEYLKGCPYSTTPDNDKIIISKVIEPECLIFKPNGEYIGKKELPSSRNLFDLWYISDSALLLTYWFNGTFMTQDLLNAMPCTAGLFDFDGRPVKLLKNPLRNTIISKTNLKRIAIPFPTFTFFDNRIVLSQEGDTIYEIDKTNILPGFILNWGSLPHKQSLEDFYYSQAESPKKVINYGTAFETSTKAYFRGSNMSTFIFEYNKITGESRSMTEDPENAGLINDLDGGTNYFPYWTNSKGDIWITYDDANIFRKKHNDEFLSKSVAVYPAMKEKLRTFLTDLKLDDNPVLKIVYLKKYADNINHQ